MKKIFSIQNIIIAFLVVIIILLTVTVFKNKNSNNPIKESTNYYKYDSDKALCQREYYYRDNDTYAISLCNDSIYINKNNGEKKELELDDALYIYNYYTIDGSLFYILTKNGDVYNISVENIINKNYTVEKLDLKDIVSIKDFYVGLTIDDAYNYKIYGIDSEGNMHLIK